jgi:hypothetical protein
MNPKTAGKLPSSYDAALPLIDPRIIISSRQIGSFNKRTGWEIEGWILPARTLGQKRRLGEGSGPGLGLASVTQLRLTELQRKVIWGDARL